MPRQRQRVCLQDGLKLDLNRLTRRGFVKPGEYVGNRGITWTNSYWGEVATGLISANMSGRYEGWFRIQLGNLDQWITLLPQNRHFGGRQWYFSCPLKVERFRYFGNRTEQTSFAVGRHGAGKSLTNLNSTMRRIERTLERCGSNRD